MKKIHLILMCLALLSNSLFAQDIDLYVGNTAQRIGKKPQVLIILDNSGSMATQESVKEPYDPDTVYPAIGGYHSLSQKFIYYAKGSGIDASNIVPDGPSEQRRFLDAINSCQTARERLAKVGYYTGHVRQYAYQGNTGSWQEIPANNGANIKVLDCWDDIQLNNPKNAGVAKSNGTITALPDGYPIDGQGTKGSPVYYTANVNSSNTQIGTGEVVTLYTDNYLRWHNNPAIQKVNLSRMDIAKSTITNLVESAPSVDFGLQIYNLDYAQNQRNGGRVVFGIQNMTSQARQNLVDIINLKVNAQTNTPLCETLYEARRYFGGLSVDFGDDDANYSYWYKANQPPRDLSIENHGTYISPYSGCSNKVYVILITDGQPTMDNSADTYIKGLPGIGAPFNVNGTNNYLSALAGWMHTHDLNDSLPGEQTSTLFTIGFGKDAVTDAGALLRSAAQQGGGKYYPAQDPSALLSSLQSALVEILRVNASFTAPSIASNNFDRTQTLDSVYYAMFLPNRGPRWQGNIKKLKVSNGIQVDRVGASAIDSSGNIAASAKTFWSTSATGDGNEVAKGGVADMLRNKTNRTIYSDIGATGGLSIFNRANAESFYGSATNLAAALNVPETEIDNTINWAQGMDVDDENNNGVKTDIRTDVFADPLHSKPLVINYGGSSTNQDIRIVVGTNAGVLHMFADKGDTVDESWAFMPKEFFKNYKTLRENYSSSSKVYGIDGSASVYVYDKNGDGTVDSAAGDKAWIFVGLRRGGSSYYALDVTDPDKPKLMWHIDSATTGFSELGQSWSTAKVGYSKLNMAGTVAKPVLFIGAGYSIGKDSSGPGTADSVGRGVYMVDAQSGTLLWSATPAASSATNTQISSITDSVPSSIAMMDSDSDGLIDRLYFGDTGGNVWRVDMPGSTPTSSTTPWTAFKLAELGGTTNADDRRFFSEPSVARALITNTTQNTVTDAAGKTSTVITRQSTPYDAILIGSGDRSTPADTLTNDKFFMVKDKNIITQSFLSGSIPAPIQLSDLYDYTNNPYGQSLTTTQKNTLDLAVSAKSGWFVDFTTSGEKSLSSATAIAGVAYFNSFTPAASSSNTCLLNTGGGSLYAIDLAQGTNVYQWRKLSVGDRVPDTPTVIIPPSVSGPSKLLFVGVGAGTGGGTITLCKAGNCDPNNPNTGISLETLRTYLYVAEPK